MRERGETCEIKERDERERRGRDRTAEFIICFPILEIGLLEVSAESPVSKVSPFDWLPGLLKSMLSGRSRSPPASL